MPASQSIQGIIRRVAEIITDFEVLEEYEFTSLVKFRLHTGRTHQIRVHTASMKHPILGDETYGGDKILYGGQSNYVRSKAQKCLQLATRQMLHAKTLGFIHPCYQSRNISRLGTAPGF